MMRSPPSSNICGLCHVHPWGFPTVVFSFSKNSATTWLTHVHRFRLCQRQHVRLADLKLQRDGLCALLVSERMRCFSA